MSFTNGEPFEITEKLHQALTKFRTSPFDCWFCGTKFQVGDIARFVMTNGHKDPFGRRLPSGNPFVCETCEAVSVPEGAEPEAHGYIRKAMADRLAEYEDTRRDFLAKFPFATIKLRF